MTGRSDRAFFVFRLTLLKSDLFSIGYRIKKWSISEKLRGLTIFIVSGKRNILVEAGKGKAQRKVNCVLFLFWANRK